MTLVRRPAVPLAIAIGGLAIAAGPALAVPSAEVVVQPRVDPEIVPPFVMTIDNASSVGNAFSIENTSTAGEDIEKVTFDLSTGDFPNMVFTPDEEAGDVGEAQPFAIGFPDVPGEPNTDIDSGIVQPTFGPAGGVSRGGFDTLEVGFAGTPSAPGGGDDDFAPGFSLVFRVDVDPNSINGTDATSSPAGPVSGAELQGATVTVEFSSGPPLTSKLSLISGTSPEGIGAQAVVSPATDAAPAPGLARAGGATSTTVASDAATASETVVVTGQPGQTGTVVVADAHFNTTGAGAQAVPNLLPATAGLPPTPEQLEVNTAKAFRETPFTIGPDGTDEVDVELSNTPGDPLDDVLTGRNVITAFRTDVASPGKTSQPVVLELDEGGDTNAPSVTGTTPAPGASGASTGGNVKISFSEQMDKGTLTNPGTISVRSQSGGPAVPASVTSNTAGTEATLDPASDLSPGTTYVVTTTTNARDLSGNGLPATATSTFTTAGASTTPPPGAGGGANPGGSPGGSPAGSPASGGTVPTAGSPVCNPVPERNTSEKGTIRYTRQALKIQQNIDSAVIRRLNAVNAWIDAGITEPDLCAGAFGPSAFQDGLSFTGGPAHPLTPPSPREIEIVKKDKDGNPITKSRRQLVINENISRALRARADATAERIATLTGGNLAPGVSLAGRAALSGLAVSGPKPPSQDGPATALDIGPLPSAITIRENAATVRKQQQRSQGSIIVANRALDAITSGLTEQNFRPGSIGSDRI